MSQESARELILYNNFYIDINYLDSTSEKLLYEMKDACRRQIETYCSEYPDTDVLRWRELTYKHIHHDKQIGRYSWGWTKTPIPDGSYNQCTLQLNEMIQTNSNLHYGKAHDIAANIAKGIDLPKILSSSMISLQPPLQLPMVLPLSPHHPSFLLYFYFFQHKIWKNLTYDNVYLCSIYIFYIRTWNRHEISVDLKQRENDM